MIKHALQHKDLVTKQKKKKKKKTEQKHKDLVILTKPRTQYDNQIFMDVGMAYWEDPYLASKELVAS